MKLSWVWLCKKAKLMLLQLNEAWTQVKIKLLKKEIDTATQQGVLLDMEKRINTLILIYIMTFHHQLMNRQKSLKIFYFKYTCYKRKLSIIIKKSLFIVYAWMEITFGFNMMHKCTKSYFCHALKFVEKQVFYQFFRALWVVV